VRTFIAGVWGHTVGRGAAVLINSTGQLGVEESSERYKTDIAPAEVSSERLQQLRPVTYRFKTDSSGDRHYGLIAEEVNRVYPDLVIRDDAGNIEGVRYDELAPILLGEIQQQQRQIAALVEQLKAVQVQVGEVAKQRAALSDTRFPTSSGSLQTEGCGVTPVLHASIGR